MVRILHTADFHVGCNRSYPNYLDRQRDALDEVMEIAEEERCDVVAFAGDFFDHSQPTHEERGIIAEFFNRCPIPIVSIVGNHDKWGLHWEDTSLNWLTKIAKRLGHRVYDAPTSEKLHGVWWLALPYTASFEKDNRFVQQDVNLLSQWLVEQVPSHAQEPRVLLTHEFYQGSKTESGYVGRSKRYPELPIYDDIDYYAMGHIHGKQELTDNAVYSGSLFQVDFGEQLPKGVLIVDIGDDVLDVNFVEVTSPRPLVTLTEIPETWPDAYIKLQVRPDELPSPLPDCVVQIGKMEGEVDTEQIQQLHKLAGKKHLLKGMSSYLKKRGFGPKAVKRGMSFAKTLIRKTND